MPNNPLFVFNIESEDFPDLLGRILESDPDYQKYMSAFYKVVEQNIGDKRFMELDNLASSMASSASRKAFKEGFHRGMKVILDAMAGKGITEL